MVALVYAANSGAGGFSLDRGYLPETRQLWFGAGRHLCLGSSLANAELRSAVQGGSNTVLIVGAIAENHPQTAAIRAAARDFATATGARLCRIPQGANAVGLTRAGVLPAGRRWSCCRKSR